MFAITGFLYSKTLRPEPACQGPGTATQKKMKKFVKDKYFSNLAEI